ncbi:efflux transporter outer membrane subunit [Gammaproteobacteria bacterium]|nr:efflux transporter outer membrane subunit [Gammaproteobacteria bacterium]
MVNTTHICKSSCLIICCMLLFLSGCSPIPNMPGLRSPDQSLNIHNQAEPLLRQTSWWKSLGDPQLNKLIDQALIHSPDIHQAQARIEKAQAYTVQMGAALEPSVTADLTVQETKQSYYNGIPKSAVPKGLKDNAKATLNFNYEFDFWGQNKAIEKTAQMNADIELLQKDQVELMLATAITSNYIQLNEWYQQQAVYKKMLNTYQQMIQLQQERLKTGIDGKQPMLTTQSMVAQTKSQVTEIQSEIQKTTIVIQTLTGLPYQAHKIYQPKLSKRVLLKLPKTIQANLMAYRPDIQAALIALQANAYKIGVARTAFYPNVNLNGYVGHQSLELKNFFNPESLIASFGPAIHLPIFQTRQLTGAYQSAYADYNLSLACYEKSILQALQETNQSMIQIHALTKQLMTAKQDLSYAHSNATLAHSLYQQGLTTKLATLKNQLDVLSKHKIIQSLNNQLIISKISLTKALGGSPHIIKQIHRGIST